MRHVESGESFFSPHCVLKSLIVASAAAPNTSVRRNPHGRIIDTTTLALDVFFCAIYACNTAVDAFIRTWRAGPKSSQELRICESLAQLPWYSGLTEPQDGEKYARELFSALESKLRDEEARRTVKARERFTLLR